MDQLRLEIAVGALAFAAAVVGILAGFSPQDWAFWYVIPAAMLAVGLLVGKRAHRRSKRGSRVVVVSLGLVSGLLIVLGSWIALEHYAATPVDLGGQPP